MAPKNVYHEKAFIFLAPTRLSFNITLFFHLFFFVQIFYVRAPQQYVPPSGVGTIKLTYTSNQAQPQTTVQYASSTPKVSNIRWTVCCSDQCTPLRVQMKSEANEFGEIERGVMLLMHLHFVIGGLCDFARTICGSRANTVKFITIHTDSTG